MSKRQMAKIVARELRKKLPVTITLTQDQIDFIDTETGVIGERSRWIRAAIDREILRKRQFQEAIKNITNDPKTGKNIAK